MDSKKNSDGLSLPSVREIQCALEQACQEVLGKIPAPRAKTFVSFVGSCAIDPECCGSDKTGPELMRRAFSNVSRQVLHGGTQVLNGGSPENLMSLPLVLGPTLALISWKSENGSSFLDSE